VHSGTDPLRGEGERGWLADWDVDTHAYAGEHHAGRRPISTPFRLESARDSRQHAGGDRSGERLHGPAAQRVLIIAALVAGATAAVASALVHARRRAHDVMAGDGRTPRVNNARGLLL